MYPQYLYSLWLWRRRRRRNRSNIHHNQSCYSYKYSDSTDDPWVPLSEDYITELLETDVPPLISWVDDPELQRKYNHALLLKEHGDIPQIRTIIEFELNYKSHAVCL